MNSTIFWDFMSAAAERVQDIGAGLLQGQAVGFAVATAAGVYTLYRSSRAIKNKKLSKGSAVLSETHFNISSDINPKTGAAFVDQRLRTIDQAINVAEIFDPTVRKAIMYYLGKAKKHCTAEEPVVFQHLDKVMSSKKFENVAPVIMKHWINYFAPLLRREYGASLQQNAGDSFYDEFQALPLLVFEPNAPYGQFKILVVDVEAFPSTVPDTDKNLRVEVGGKMVYEDHYLKERWKTCAAICSSLEGNDSSFLMKFSVGVPVVNQVTPQELIR